MRGKEKKGAIPTEPGQLDSHVGEGSTQILPHRCSGESTPPTKETSHQIGKAGRKKVADSLSRQSL
jgi:hypothetical protein